LPYSDERSVMRAWAGTHVAFVNVAAACDTPAAAIALAAVTSVRAKTRPAGLRNLSLGIDNSFRSS
jgi:hypothetical protein